MSEPIADDVLSSVERIDRAIARIEQTIRSRAAKEDALARRHAALKARMAEAVSALDASVRAEIIDLLVSSQEEKIEVVYQGGTPGDIHGIFADITQMNNIFGDWEKVDRNSAENDQVIIDFEGTIEGEPFDGNTAKDFKLVIGSKSMIPGFEDQLINKKINSDFEIKTNFPDDYFKKDLAGKEAVFKINLKEVQENVPSKINKDLYEKLAMEVKNENEFRDEIRKRMENESLTQEKTLTKDSMYELLLKINKFSAPQCTIREQSELMRKEALSRIGRNPEEESDNDLFPLDTFKENAEKRVKLDLLFTALLNHYDLKVNQDDLKEFIEEEAKRYKDPKQFETWVYNQPNQLDQYRMIVLENQLVEKLDNDLKSKDKVINFKDLSKY